MPKLLIVIASTRPGRVGLPVGEWFAERAAAHGKFDLRVVDLKELDLPFMDEPKHPRLQQYEHQHTKDWSAIVAAADAVVFVTPEYNHGYTAPLKNAIDYLNREWQHKPAGIVSYGGVAAGTRAAQQLKQVLVVLGLVPIPTGVMIPFVAKHLGADGAFASTDLIDQSADELLDELLVVQQAYAPRREAMPDAAA